MFSESLPMLTQLSFLQEHCTVGVEAVITAQRVIFLDMQVDDAKPSHA